jgi:hypothetical protein
MGDKFKIYPVIAPQGEKAPYITVFKPTNDPVTSLTKDLASSLDYPRVSVNCWAVNFRDTELMFEAVRTALDNQSSVTDAGYSFLRIWLVDDREGFDPETKLYLHSATFGIEQTRLEGDFFEMLTAAQITKWGGLWDWSAHGNAFPTNVKEGTVWVTVGDITLSGNAIPDGTIMISKQDGANEYSEFSFNL